MSTHQTSAASAPRAADAAASAVASTPTKLELLRDSVLADLYATRRGDADIRESTRAAMLDAVKAVAPDDPTAQIMSWADTRFEKARGYVECPKCITLRTKAAPR